MKKNEPQPKTDVMDYQIKVSLNQGYCDKTFKDALRNGTEKGHAETLLVNTESKGRKKREQISHVFSGETDVKPDSHINSKYIADKVMFDDGYVEKNPKIKKGKIVRYEKEKELKNSKHLYSDDLYISPGRQATLDRKIKDNYGKNPIEILDKKQTDEYNKIQREKVAKRTQAIDGYLTSEKVKRTFRSLKKDPYPMEKIPKVTNDNFDQMTQPLKKRDEPNYPKRHFQIAKVTGTDAYTYL